MNVIELPTRVGRAMRSSATANARTAARAISAAVATRSELTSLLLSSDEPAAGALRPLTTDECVDLLRTRQVGRFVYIARAGMPDVAPVNYALHGLDIVIRSGPGPKLQAAERRDLVAFEVDDLNHDGRPCWSVVVHGQARRLPVADARALQVDAHPWAEGPRSVAIVIEPRRISGRRLT